MLERLAAELLCATESLAQEELPYLRNAGHLSTGNRSVQTAIYRRKVS
jgi:hypothetical protein